MNLYLLVLNYVLMKAVSVYCMMHEPGHSGTAILDLASGGNRQTVALGEGEASPMLRELRPSDNHNGPRLLRGLVRFSRLCPYRESCR